MPVMDREARFCYRCGKRVGKSALNCWYCSAPISRVIRPPRNCPFCQEKIGPKAIKCPHCGEFVDGRPAQNPQHVTLNIDKAVFAPGGMPQFGAGQMPPGQQIAPGQASYDPSRTLDAQGQPFLPPDAGPRSLPAQGPMLLPGMTQPPDQAGQELQGGPSSLAPYQGQPPQQAQMPLGHPARMPLGHPQQAPMVPHGAIPATPAGLAAPPADEERYDICPVCDTEVLATDSYCYYCGQLRAAAKAGKAKPIGGQPNGWAYFGMLLFFGAARVMEMFTLPEIADGPLIRLILISGACLLAVAAFFRNKRLLSRILTGLVLLAGLLILFM